MCEVTLLCRGLEYEPHQQRILGIMSYTARAFTTALRTYFFMGDILTKFKQGLNVLSFLSNQSCFSYRWILFVVVAVIGENCEIVKVSVFVIYLPKSSGCCIHFWCCHRLATTHIFLQIASSLVEACTVSANSPSLAKCCSMPWDCREGWFSWIHIHSFEKHVSRDY